MVSNCSYFGQIYFYFMNCMIAVIIDVGFILGVQKHMFKFQGMRGLSQKIIKVEITTLCGTCCYVN